MMKYYQTFIHYKHQYSLCIFNFEITQQMGLTLQSQTDIVHQSYVISTISSNHQRFEMKCCNQD